jgi:RHS repeat-associated protein
MYGYNNANRLISAVETDTATSAMLQSASYVYDVFGNLLSESVTVDGTTTVSQFGYMPGGTLYANVGSGGTIQTRYVAGVGGADTWLARVESGGGGAWLLSDHQGSVTRVVGLTGDVLDAINYDAFGNVVSETDPTTRGELGFQGGRYDSVTGNWMFGVREYDPGRRDWITQDPSGFAAGDANLYRYVGNSPTNATDPSGLDSIKVPGGTLEEKAKGRTFSLTYTGDPKRFKVTQVMQLEVYYEADYKDKNGKEVSTGWILSTKRGEKLEVPEEPGEKKHDHDHVIATPVNPNLQTDHAGSKDGFVAIDRFTVSEDKKSVTFSDSPNAARILIPAVPKVLKERVYKEGGVTFSICQIKIVQRFITTAYVDGKPVQTYHWTSTSVGTWGTKDYGSEASVEFIGRFAPNKTPTEIVKEWWLKRMSDIPD